MRVGTVWEDEQRTLCLFFYDERGGGGRPARAVEWKTYHSPGRYVPAQRIGAHVHMSVRNNCSSPRPSEQCLAAHVGRKREERVPEGWTILG